MPVTREQFINKLQELDFKYKTETRRTSEWRRGMQFVYLPKKKRLPDTWVQATLVYMGCTQEQIANFLRNCN